MARRDARKKKGAQAAPENAGGAPADGKGDGVHAPALESGVCIVCGGEKAGTPSEPEPPIRAARWLRARLGQPPRHTVACKEHIGEARARRGKYEKKARDYGVGAILFFA